VTKGPTGKSQIRLAQRANVLRFAPKRTPDLRKASAATGQRPRTIAKPLIAYR